MSGLCICLLCRKTESPPNDKRQVEGRRSVLARSSNLVTCAASPNHTFASVCEALKSCSPVPRSCFDGFIQPCSACLAPETLLGRSVQHRSAWIRVTQALLGTSRGTRPRAQKELQRGALPISSLLVRAAVYGFWNRHLGLATQELPARLPAAYNKMQVPTGES